MSIVSMHDFYPDGSVRTDPQQLSDRQKEQARTNIEAAGKSLGVTDAKVGDTFRAAEVVDGRVTRWERKPEEKWELIEKLTTETSAVFSRSAEPDRTGYQFRAVRVKMSLQVEFSSGMWFIGNQGDIACIYADINSAYGKCVYTVERRYGYWDGVGLGKGGNEGFEIHNVFEGFRYLNNNSSEFCKKIYTQRPVPAGTMIEIWAVRA